jgi:hypothetical protein
MNSASRRPGYRCNCSRPVSSPVTGIFSAWRRRAAQPPAAWRRRQTTLAGSDSRTSRSVTSTSSRCRSLAPVTTAGREITDVATDLAGIDDLRVEITQRVGRVSGRVAEREQPSATHGVVLYAEAADLRTFPSRFVHVAHADALGNFKIPNVLPGRYLALALPDNTTKDVDLDWLETRRAAAVSVVVSEGQEARLVVQIRRPSPASPRRPTRASR